MSIYSVSIVAVGLRQFIVKNASLTCVWLVWYHSHTFFVNVCFAGVALLRIHDKSSNADNSFDSGTCHEHHGRP